MSSLWLIRLKDRPPTEMPYSYGLVSGLRLRRNGRDLFPSYWRCGFGTLFFAKRLESHLAVSEPKLDGASSLGYVKNR